MKSLTIFHTGDGHFSRENQEPFFKSIDHLIKTADSGEAPDLIVIAGDLFDRAVHDTEASGFPRLICWMKNLMDIAPVVAVRGTPTHDPPGCYEVFKEIEAKHEFCLLEPSVSYFLTPDERVEENNDFGGNLLIFGLPEPSKEHFLKDKRLGKAEADELINQGMREMLLGMGAIRKQYPEIPCLFVGHIEVRDTPTCTSHIIQGGIKIGKDDLALVGADYYALGHIHLGQQVGNLPAYYSGSMFPVNWGELDQKVFNIVTLSEEGCGNKHIPFPHPPRKKIVLNEPWDIPLSEVNGFEIWLQLRATKEQRTIFDTDAMFQGLIEAGADDGSKVEIVTIPTETVRSEQISEAV